MRFFSSEIVADARNIELELFRSPEERQQYLVSWFNGHVAAQGLDEEVEPLRDGTSAEFAAMMIEETLDRPVILGEVYV